jgi:ubiquinone/menaquinone biosynthesis C-methylase UbiE
MEPDLIDMFAAASVISAAQETGLLGALLSPPRRAGAYADALGLDPRATGIVLDALVGLDLARREGDAYEASARVRAFIERHGQGGLPAIALWGHTSAFLRTGEPFVRLDVGLGAREATYRAAAAGLAHLLETVARELAAKLTTAPGRVLDVGCGSGVWSLAVAERFPQTRVTGQDLPGVLEPFLARAAALGLGDRVATIAGDMHEVLLPDGGFDLVVVANVLRLETAERAASLIARLAKAVAPGGALLVVDALAGGTPDRERARALYAVNLALRSHEGRVHGAAEIAAWLMAAGLGAPVPIDLGGHVAPPGAVGALLARR